MWGELRISNVRLWTSGPWLLVTVPDGQLAIWTATGAVHRVRADGTVEDEPITLPGTRSS